ncbi:transposase, partial [Paracoccus siganidrum]|uniref:transposase n=1 Tax=Paracoccus siganidrum TaxID=1276757 RepID=UPI001F0BB3A4
IVSPKAAPERPADPFQKIPTAQARNSGRATPSRRSVLVPLTGKLLRRRVAGFYPAVDSFDLVMEDNLPEPCVLLADRGYDSDRGRRTMEARNVVPVIPMRKSLRLRVAVDRRLYRLRNLVERCFNRLKNARRVATRYDKTAESFLGFIDITSIRLWLRHLST